MKYHIIEKKIKIEFSILIFEGYQGIQQINSSTLGKMKHFGNRKNEKLLKSPIFYGKNEFPVEMRLRQLITEINSIFYFTKNCIADLSSKIAKKLSMTQHF